MRAARGAHVVILNWRDRRHPAAGGAELYCERTARELAARGHRVTVVTSRPAGAPAREEVDGYTVRRLGGWVSVYPLALAWLARHRGEVEAVVDSANGVPFFSPLVVGATPVVLLVHHVHQDLFTRALPAPLDRFAAWLEGPATRAVYGRRTVVVLSPSTRTAVRRRLRLRGPVRVVPGGADTRDVVAVRSEQPRVVVVGRLSPYKRLDTLVTAMASVARDVPGAELHLVGDGAERQRLEVLARELRAPVVFHGRLSDADRDAVLTTAWLTVSASDGGDWALSLLEANAAGVPALARRVTGMRDTVRHGETGWLVDESSSATSPASTLAAAVSRALTELQDPRAAAVVRTGASRWARRFSWERTADGVLSALRSEALRVEQARAAGERRAGNDVSVVLELPRTALPDGWHPHLAGSRREDRWTLVGDRVRVLLAGADEVDARGLLQRLAVDPQHPSISVLVARHADVVDAARTTDQQPGGRDVA